MALKLRPETEQRVRDYAIEKGVTIEELIDHAFPPVQDSEQRVNQLLANWQSEYGLPKRPDGKVRTSLTELFDTWAEEDNLLAEDEIKQESSELSSILSSNFETTI